MSSDLDVLDISHYQSTPYWADLIEAGVIGVIFKATEGTGYVDDTFASRRPAAQAAGLCTSSYHFLRHGSISSQMSHYLNIVKPKNGERLCLDWEDANVTYTELQQAIQFLLDIPSTNYQVTVYASSGFLDAHCPDKYDPVLSKTSLWVARYDDNPPYFPTHVWPTWSLWQYTDDARIKGWGPVDANRFNGSSKQCKKWFGPAEAVSQPKPVEISIASHGQPVTVTLDGVRLQVPEA